MYVEVSPVKAILDDDEALVEVIYTKLFTVRPRALETVGFPDTPVPFVTTILVDPEVNVLPVKVEVPSKATSPDEVRSIAFPGVAGILSYRPGSLDRAAPPSGPGRSIGQSNGITGFI